MVFSTTIVVQGVSSSCHFQTSLAMLNAAEVLGLQVRLVPKGTCMVVPQSLQRRGAGKTFPVSHA